MIEGKYKAKTCLQAALHYRKMVYKIEREEINKIKQKRE